MKTIALFTSRGGVGRSSLAYHLGSMFAEMGHRIVLADLDPQANLSAMCLAEDRLEAIWTLTPRPTIHGAIERLVHGTAEIDRIALEPVSARINLVLGDLQLAELEDDFAQQWQKCLEGDERAFRITTALHRVVQDAGTRSAADLALLAVGPNLGAINRSALIAADHVIVPVAPDLFSMLGLENAGPRLATWRDQWVDRRDRTLGLGFDLPSGDMAVLGYVVVHHSGSTAAALNTQQRWLEAMPAIYRKSFQRPEASERDLASDEYCLARLRDYRSLAAMALEAKRPMFLLKPADGAIGGHQGAVRQAYNDFRKLAELVIERMGGL